MKTVTLKLHVNGRESAISDLFKLYDKSVGLFSGLYWRDPDSYLYQMQEEAFYYALKNGSYTSPDLYVDDDFYSSVEGTVAVIHDESEDIEVKFQIIPK